MFFASFWRRNGQLKRYFGLVRLHPRTLIRSPYLPLAALLLLGLLLNAWHAQSAWSGPDGALYLELATLMKTPGYFFDPESFWGNYWPAGYVIVLSSLGFTSESSFRDIALINAGLNCLTALGCWYLTRIFDSRIRLVVVGLVLISPDILWSSRVVGYEALLACLIVWTLLLAWSVRSSRARLLCGGAAGVLFFLALIVQSRVLVLLPVLAYLAWRRGRTQALGFVAGMGIVGIPWLIRGQLTYGKLSLLTTNGPINVWIGSNPEATTGGYMPPPVTPLGYINGSIAYFKESPYGFLDLALRRSARFFVPIADDPGWPERVNVLYAVWAFVFALALLTGLILWWTGCLWRGPARMPGVAPLAISATLYGLTALPFAIEPRYRTPITPLLICVLIPTLVAGGLALRDRLRLWRAVSSVPD